jgi:hypothetical protein
MVNVLIDVPDKIHRRLKMWAAYEGVTLRQKIIDCLGDVVWVNDDGSWADFVADWTKEESKSD